MRVTLHDAQGDLVVYSRGIAITLLGLSSGRSAELDLPNQAGPTDAALEADGLYYSYNVAHTPRPGRIAFVPAPPSRQRSAECGRQSFASAQVSPTPTSTASAGSSG